MTQYLVFDIGGTNVKYALVDNEGQLLEKGKRPSADNLDDFVAALYEVGDQYKDKFAGIAVCAPGKIDREKMIIHYGGALTFLDGLNLEETLGARYRVAVSAENDAKAAALCEQWLGELKGVDIGAVMTLGTGVGGGISAQEILIEEIRRQFEEILKDNPILGQQVIPPEIVAAKFRNDTNLYGALFALLQGMQKKRENF